MEIYAETEFLSKENEISRSTNSPQRRSRYSFTGSNEYMKVKQHHLSSGLNTSPPNCTNGPLVRSTSLAKSHTLVCMRQRALISTCVLWAAGQADTYEIFPLLTFATASAGEINHALTHARRSSNNTSNKPVLLGMIIASFDLFQPHFNK